MAQDTFKYNSWGRTRSPKNLAITQGAPIKVYPNTTPLIGITAAAGQLGYNTENQRYLHVLIEETNDESDTNATVTTIFGYCHAFQRWFALPETEAGGEGQNTANADVSIDPPNSSTTPANHVPTARAYRIYHIAGIDKVAFVNANPDRVNVFAACSTF